MGLRERFGRYDDKGAGGDWAPYVLGSASATLLIAVASVFVDEAVAIGVCLVLVVGALVAYVIWRRRRNRRLTGSATTWPS